MLTHTPCRLLLRRFFFSHAPNPNHISSSINLLLSLQSPPLHTLLPSHAAIIVSGNAGNPFIAAKLVSLYAHHLKPQCSDKVFDSVTFKDVFLWNSIIQSHFSNGEYSEVLDYYRRMRSDDRLPDNFTAPMVVSACAEILERKFGEGVHGLVCKLAILGGNSAVGSSLVYFYSKCGCVDNAAKVFDEMSVRDVIGWTALVIGYVQNGESQKGLECISRMHKVGIDGQKPNSRTFEGGFQACGNLGAADEGRCLHGLVIKSGYSDACDVQSSVLSMYSKCGDAEEAYNLLCEVEKKDLLCWTSVIGAYAQIGRDLECLRLFKAMQDSGIHPDGIVISCVLSSFRDSTKTREGRAFHGLIVRRNYFLDNVVHSGLIAMYCRFGLLGVAESLLYMEDVGSLESWSIMAGEYGKMGRHKNCIDLFREMQRRGIECDMNCIGSVISSCSQLRESQLGQSLHCYLIKAMLHENTSISNLLIDLYGKCGKLDSAERVLHKAKRDTVSWNTLMSAYVHKGRFADAISLFDTMVSFGSTPNSATFVTALSACSHAASLEKGRGIHNYIEKTGTVLNLPLATALVDMYGKCGQLKKAKEIFYSISERDVISWNVMISCYGVHGDAVSAIEIFRDMENSRVQLNEVTFLALLSACNYSGVIEEGRSFFYRMRDYSVTPTLKHYACMVDLLAKSGNLLEAEELVLSMPIAPDGGIWGTLLGACKIYGEVEIGLRVFKRAIESDPENDGYYILMSTLLDSIGRWEEGEAMRRMMKDRGLRKDVGWSSL